LSLSGLPAKGRKSMMQHRPHSTVQLPRAALALLGTAAGASASAAAAAAAGAAAAGVGTAAACRQADGPHTSPPSQPRHSPTATLTCSTHATPRLLQLLERAMGTPLRILGRAHTLIQARHAASKWQRPPPRQQGCHHQGGGGARVVYVYWHVRKRTCALPHPHTHARTTQTTHIGSPVPAGQTPPWLTAPPSQPWLRCGA